MILLLQQTPAPPQEDEDREEIFRALIEKEIRAGVKLVSGDFNLEWGGQEKRGTFVKGVELATAGSGLRIRADRGVLWYDPDKEGTVQEIYAEGNIIFQWGDDTLQADKLYFDFNRIQGKAVGVRLGLKNLQRWVAEGDESDWGRGTDRTPRVGKDAIKEVYISAKEIRILGPSLYEAEDARVTTCDYGEPHYAIEASSVEVIEGRRIKVRSATARVLGVPLLYWPYLYWSMDWNPYIPSFRVGNSSEFGPFVESDWILYSGKGLRVGADLDYYEQRGTGYGLNARYHGRDFRGKALGYRIQDRGEDELPLPFSREPDGFAPDPQGEEMERARWRSRWLHRHRLPLGLEIYGEYSESSDRNFLPEYFEREFRESKDQETLLYLKKIRPFWGVTALYKVRRNDFESTTEVLPQVTLDVVKAPVFGVPLIGRAVHYTQRTELANLRFRPDDVQVKTGIDLDGNGLYQPAPGPDLDPPRFDTFDPAAYDLDGDEIPDFLPRVRSWRFDTFHEARLPIPLGPVTMAPFISGRYTLWEKTFVTSDGADRGQAGAGARLDTQVHRAWDTQVPGLQINGLRHVFNPSLTYFIRYLNTNGPDGVIPFDSIDRIDETEAVTLNLRNRIQTRRRALYGLPGQTSVDLLDFEIEGSYFPSRRAPPDRRQSSDIKFDLRTNMLPYLVLFGQAEVDPSDGHADSWSFGGLTSRPGVYSAGFSFRKVRPLFLTGGADNPRHFVHWGSSANLTEKWAVEASGQYDLNLGRIVNQAYTVKRFLHQWVINVSVGRDEGRGDNYLGFSITLRDLDRPQRIVVGGRQDFAGLAPVE